MVRPRHLGRAGQGRPARHRACPKTIGGGGYGFLEVCLLLEEQGRTVAPMPLWPPWCRAPSPSPSSAPTSSSRPGCPASIAGTHVLTAALSELGTGPHEPQTEAVADGDGWRCTGAKPSSRRRTSRPASSCRPAPTTDVGLFVVPADGRRRHPRAPGHLRTTSRSSTSSSTACRSGADALGWPISDGQAQLDWIVDRPPSGSCAHQRRRATRPACASPPTTSTSASSSTGRSAPSRPSASAWPTAYVDAAAIHLTMLQAATQLADAPSTTRRPKIIAVAKYWAADGGSRVGHAALHLHGGI